MMSHTQTTAASGTLALRLWLLASSVVLLDSLLSYFARAWTGQGLQVNAILPLLILPALLASSSRAATLPPSALIALVVGFFGFVLGLFTFDAPSLGRFATISSGFAAFVVGYAMTMHLGERSSTAWTCALFFVGAAYAVVCVGALLKVAPAWLPTIEALRFRDGEMVLRPEVTTDQNFQIFYLLPCVIPLLLAQRISAWAIAAALACLAALWVLAQLQTRSGAIVFAGAIALAAFAIVRRSRRKVLLLAIGAFVLVIAVTMGFSRLVALLGPLVDRFTKDDFSTFEGRLWSAAYLFERVLDPRWWIPQGNEPFFRLSGGEVPHFNGTAFFLEGGVFGVYCWLAAHVYPTVRLAFMFWRGRLTPLGEAVAVMAACTLLASMTLNVPYVEQVWMWAGAAVAACLNPALCVSDRTVLVASAVPARTTDPVRERLHQPRFGNLMR